MMWVLGIFCGAAIVFVIGTATYAIRMSYEKMCIRTRKPFKSWIGDGR